MVEVRTILVVDRVVEKVGVLLEVEQTEYMMDFGDDAVPRVRDLSCLKDDIMTHLHMTILYVAVLYLAILKWLRTTIGQVLLWICVHWIRLKGIIRGCRRLITGLVYRRGGISPCCWVCCWWTPSAHLLLCARLLNLESGGSSLYQSVFDGSSNVGGKHGPRIKRPGYGLFPSLKHLIELSTYRIVDKAVGNHKSLIKIAAEEKGIWSSDVLDN